jgi:hypothetical protein
LEKKWGSLGDGIAPKSKSDIFGQMVEKQHLRKAVQHYKSR